MPAATIPSNEVERQRVLDDLSVLDTPAEEEFDCLVRAAALVCDTPISLLSLVDHDRQWFKANYGAEGVAETPRDLAFCAHAIHRPQLMEITDATQDPRFSDNVLVTSDPAIRFYAGIPLEVEPGLSVGTLCVIDRQPRQLDNRQRQILVELARAAVLALRRRQVARQVEIAEARFRALSDASPLGAFATDAAGRFTYVNEAWSSIFAGTGEWTDQMSASDQPALRSAWADVTANGGDLNVKLDRGVEAHYVRVAWRNVRNAERKFAGRVGVADDVTVERRANERLETQSTLLVAQAQRKNDFLAALGHELRGPLSALRTAVQIMRMEANRSKRVDAALGIMDRQLEQTVSLTDALLDVARINEGKVELTLSPVDLNALVEVALEASQSVLGSRNHELVVDLTERPLVCSLDASRMIQVITNLLTNAAKYTEPGGRIAVATRTAGAQAVLTVSDNGRGIPAAALEFIFGMFEQLPDHSDMEQGGLGIGLALVKQLVELHGGSVSARSEGRGKGSSFSIWMPLLAIAAAREGVAAK